MNYGILYSGFPAVLEGYIDANWIYDSYEIKSTSGYVFTMESKFIALECTGQEAKWLRNFLLGIPLGMQPTPSVSMHCDCQAAISIKIRYTNTL